MSNISSPSTLTQASTQWASRPDDQRFTSLIDLRDSVVAQRRRSSAKVVSSRSFEAKPDPACPANKGLLIETRNGHVFTPSHWGFGQLATLAGAPAGYLRDKLPAPLAADCLNWGLQVNRNVDDVGLLLQREEGDGPNLIRAATGPNYGRVWNSEIAESLVRRFGDGVTGDWTVPGEFGVALDQVTKANTTLFASDQDMFVFLADEKHRIEIPNRRNGQSGSLARGFFVWNSEVGAQTLGIAAFLFDYACCNRIVWGAEGYREIKIRHTSGAPDRFVEQVQPLLLEYAHSSAKGVEDTLKAAQAKTLGDKKAEFLANRFGRATAKLIEEAHLREEGRPIETLWDATTGVTAHAKSIRHQDARVDLERAGGKLLDLVTV